MILIHKNKRCCLNTNIHSFFKRKADQTVREELTARQDCLKQCLRGTDKDFKIHCDDIALHELGVQLRSQRMELYRAN